MRTLLIIVGQPIVCRGIEAILNDAGLSARTAAATTVGEAIAALEAASWDAAVVDIGQSDSVGIGLVARIAQEWSIRGRRY